MSAAVRLRTEFIIIIVIRSEKAPVKALPQPSVIRYVPKYRAGVRMVNAAAPMVTIEIYYYRTESYYYSSNL